MDKKENKREKIKKVETRETLINIYIIRNIFYFDKNLQNIINCSFIAKVLIFWDSYLDLREKQRDMELYLALDKS